MILEWPQITMASLTLIGLGVALAKDGEPKKEKHSFWFSVFNTVLCYIILYYGGFFGGVK